MALQNWNLDTVHSTIGFTVRHLMVSKVRGYFTKWSGSAKFDPENPTASSVEASIDVASIDTREAQRDGHLKSGDFFDVEKHPKMTFKSTKVEKASGDHYKLTGDLTIRGVTKPVTLDVEYAGTTKHPQFGERAGFSAKTSIDRKDFGMTFNQALDTGGVLLSDKVDIELEIQATKA